MTLYTTVNDALSAVTATSELNNSLFIVKHPRTSMLSAVLKIMQLHGTETVYEQRVYMDFGTNVDY